MDPIEQQLRSIYASFNARDFDAVLAVVTPDVDWPNGWEGGRVLGREAVRDYWLRQWSEIDPHVDPVSIAARPDGRFAVEVHQVVRDLRGELLADDTVWHVYTVRDNLIERMEIEKPPAGPA